MTREAARHALARGDFAAARDLYRAHCNAGGNADDWLTLARIQHRLGDPAAARNALERAFDLAPTTPAVAQAMAHTRLGEADEPAAVAILERAYAEHPQAAELATDLAILYEARGAVAEAMTIYSAILHVHPNAARARLNRAAHARDSGRFELALNDYDELIDHPRLRPQALLGRAECLRSLRRWGEAVAACDTLLKIDAGHIRARICAGIALAGSGQIARAQALLDAVWVEAPQQLQAYAGNAGMDRVPDARAIFLLAAQARLDDADWRDYGLLAQRAENIYADAHNAPDTLELAYPAMYLPLTPTAACHAHIAVSQRLAHETAAMRSTPVRRPHGSRIRLAYLRSTYREHPSAHLNGALYACHDRDRFEVFAYATNADDGSAIRRRISATFDHFHDVSGLDDHAIAARIEADQIDILIDGDGYSDGARPAVLARRPAPIQVSYFGHMHSLYAPWIDYRLTATSAEPAVAPVPMPEKRAFIPGSFFTYDTQGVVPLMQTSRREHGLPEDAFVLCALGRVNKICPQVFATWMAIMHKLPQAVLWLSESSVVAQRNLIGHAINNGVRAERLIFAPSLPRAAHVARHQVADVFLDTFRFNAHTTALDALHAGLPIVTCPGPGWAQRLCASFLYTVGLSELVAASFEDYAEIVLRLAHEPHHLCTLRARLRARMGENNPFASRTVAAHFERAFATMWSRHCDGLPAVDLHFDSDDLQ